MLGGGRPLLRGVRSRTYLLVVALVASSAWGLAARVQSATLSCGTTVTKSIRLSGDVGPCASGGIVVTADNVTIDLGGHRVFGTDSRGDGVGITLQGTQGVTVSNGSVTNFDAGVVIAAGGANTITRVKAIANVGGGGISSFGDGIVVDASSGNLLSRNEVRGNGPFSGISVINNGSVGNKIAKNTVQDNDIPLNDTTNNNVGIRLEPHTRETTVKRNVVSFSGLDGIQVFQGSKKNVLLENTVKFNGFHDEPHRKGDGIRVFGADGADENLIQDNASNDNAANGIILSLNATQNVVKRNTAKNNGLGAPGSLDLVDANPGCDSNSWRNNTAGSVSPSCVH
jgi:large repetitive protein